MFTRRFRSFLCSNFRSVLLPEPHVYSNFLSSHSLSGKACASTPPSDPENSVLSNFLVDSFKFPKQRALKYATLLQRVKSLEIPLAVVQLLKTYGLSDAEIQSAVSINPHILGIDPKTIKPKLVYFEELGLSGPCLRMLISKNSSLLTYSLAAKLKPRIGIIKKVLEQNEIDDNDISETLFQILRRSFWVMVDESRFLSCIASLESCGIVGSQLIMLLKYAPQIVSLSEEELEALFSKVKEMGFVKGSKKFVYGIMVCYGHSAEALNRKFELFQSFGFSQYEIDEMIVKQPFLFKLSETNLSRGIEFFLHTFKVDRSLIVGSPHLLSFSLEETVIPRLRVLEMIKSRRLVKKEPALSTLFSYSRQMFMEKFIFKFADDAEELLAAYEGRFLESSKE